MRIVTVYYVDYLKNLKIPIGEVVERRRKERGNNLSGLLLVARKKYAKSPQEAFQIALERKCLHYSSLSYLVSPF